MSDAYPLFRSAEVISTKDPEDLGRIQLRVFPELAKIPENDLPWCLPLASGPHDGDFSTPPEKKWVYCVVWNKYWSEIEFLPWAMPDPKKPKFKDFKDNHVGKITDFDGTPDVQHTTGSILEDGFVTFHDTKNSQHGVLHPSGTFAMINKDGELFVHSVKKMTFHNKDDSLAVTVDSETGDVELKTKGGVKITADKNVEKEIKGNDEEKITGDWKIKVTGNTSIETAGNTDVKTTGNTKIESTGKLDVCATGPASVESKAVTTVKSASMVIVDSPVLNFKGMKTQGTVPPSGSGIGCAFPACVVCGVPHNG